MFFDPVTAEFFWAEDGANWANTQFVGPPGQDGSGVDILSGAGAPAAGLGAAPTAGALYFDTTDTAIYTRPAGGAWSPPTVITATDGADGNTILNGTGQPLATVGVDGDFYIDTTSLTMFGPKAGGAWPTPGTSMMPGTLAVTAQMAAQPGDWAVNVSGASPNYTLTMTAPNTDWRLVTTDNDGTMPVAMTATYDTTNGGVINFTLPVDVFVQRGRSDSQSVPRRPVGRPG